MHVGQGSNVRRQLIRYLQIQQIRHLRSAPVCVSAQAGGGSEQLTYLLFLKMADKRTSHVGQRSNQQAK